MRILIVSAFFPPYNAIGALRVGKLAKFLVARGHEVRVVSAAEEGLPKTADLEIPAEHVRATGWVDVNALPARLLRRKIKDYREGTQDLGRTITFAGHLYRTLFNMPDSHVGWYRPARAAADEIIRDWRPDLIYASATPVTALLVAANLARRHRIPWVAEMRDLWVDNHYYSFPRWRRMLETILERKVLSTASLLVTVSEPLAEVLRAKFGKPTVVVMNGFDPADLPDQPVPPRDGRLNILYTGMIYPGRRDPTPLFEALRAMGPEADNVRVHFYGRLLPGMQALVRQCGVEHLVEMHGPVSYRESLRLQAEADVLLLLLWDTPEERGVFTGKLFEYLAARRPILTLGLSEGVAADLIRDRQAGAVATSPEAIATQLRTWLEIKRSRGEIPPLAADVAQGLSRDDQFVLLEPHLRQAVEAGPARRRDVLVVTRKLDVGGTERHLLQVLPRLDRRRFAISLMALRPGGKLDSDFRAAGIPVLAPPARLSGWPALIWSAARLVLLMVLRRDMVVHFFLPEAYAVGGLCGLLACHGHMAMSRRSLNLYQAAHPKVAWLERFLHRRMEAVLGNSKAVLDDLTAEGAPADRLHLIYNGIDLAPFDRPVDREALRQSLGIGPDEIVFLMVANLIPYKGHADLIQALADAEGRLPPWRLLLVGRDDGIANFLRRAVARRNVGDKVLFLGERFDVPSLLGASDVGILCSHQEGFANSVLEGMAARLPMVVTRAGGNAEAVVDGETGLVVPAKDPGALGEALGVLACAPDRRRTMGIAGRRRVEEVFSLEACVRAYGELYDRL